jgi:hypothetical protein
VCWAVQHQKRKEKKGGNNNNNQREKKKNRRCSGQTNGQIKSNSTRHKRTNDHVYTTSLEKVSRYFLSRRLLISSFFVFFLTFYFTLFFSLAGSQVWQQQ